MIIAKITLFQSYFLTGIVKKNTLKNKYDFLNVQSYNHNDSLPLIFSPNFYQTNTFSQIHTTSTLLTDSHRTILPYDDILKLWTFWPYMTKLWQRLYEHIRVVQKMGLITYNIIIYN